MINRNTSVKKLHQIETSFVPNGQFSTMNFVFKNEHQKQNTNYRSKTKITCENCLHACSYKKQIDCSF